MAAQLTREEAESQYYTYLDSIDITKSIEELKIINTELHRLQDIAFNVGVNTVHDRNLDLALTNLESHLTQLTEMHNSKWRASIVNLQTDIRRCKLRKAINDRLIMSGGRHTQRSKRTRRSKCTQRSKRTRRSKRTQRSKKY